MTAPRIRYAVEDGIAHLTLTRGDAANAMDLQMAQELMDATLRADEDRAVRAVLLDAEGKLFCAGGDLASFAAAGDEMPKLIKNMTTYLHAALSRLFRMRAPVVVAVQGAAAGAGLSLACAGDLVIASEKAKFTMAYTKAGLVPDGSSTWTLPRLIGTRRTLELMLTNRVLTAAEAESWGLVNRVVPAESLAGEATKLARALADGPTEAFGAAKRLVRESSGDFPEAQMEREGRAIGDSARTADAREGVQAFLDKRAPVFRGE